MQWSKNMCDMWSQRLNIRLSLRTCNHLFISNLAVSPWRPINFYWDKGVKTFLAWDAERSREYFVFKSDHKQESYGPEEIYLLWYMCSLHSLGGSTFLLCCMALGWLSKLLIAALLYVYNNYDNSNSSIYWSNSLIDLSSRYSIFITRRPWYRKEPIQCNGRKTYQKYTKKAIAW